MKTVAWCVFFYGLLLIIGGLIGHFKAGSTASLVMGVVAGILILLCSLGIFKRKPYSLYGAFLLTVLLEAFFIYRYAHTLKFMPPGLLSVISLAVLILLGLQLRPKS